METFYFYGKAIVCTPSHEAFDIVGAACPEQSRKNKVQ